MMLEDFDDLVAGISQRAFYSGWQDEIELELWLIAVGARGTEIGQTKVTADELLRMRQHLSEGTWIVWRDGPVFVPLVEWLATFDRSRADSSKHWMFRRDD